MSDEEYDYDYVYNGTHYQYNMPDSDEDPNEPLMTGPTDETYTIQTKWAVMLTPEFEFDELGDAQEMSRREFLDELKALDDETKASLLDEALERADPDDPSLFSTSIVNWLQHADDLGMEKDKHKMLANPSNSFDEKPQEYRDEFLDRVVDEVLGDVEAWVVSDGPNGPWPYKSLFVKRTENTIRVFDVDQAFVASFDVGNIAGSGDEITENLKRRLNQLHHDSLEAL